MKEFDKIIINGKKEIFGVGLYSKRGDNLIIDSREHKLTQSFIDLIRNNPKVKDITFYDSLSDDPKGVFAGPFIIPNINDNVITLVKLVK
ncbi:hypothetical protein [Oceanobacillus sp. J11TS1]|uniref:hypothetical protein n=1 Tax=Oceanobacillus sp. J11TS1 TaxID=2807191 RepID=UPI001B13DF39|nr:hypothetical protein [Oceanobacillus sp. J11TS1]GIO25113.1 hypothetical protein J11TS1_36940 [Oceanobacillus sp. J11TS1]